MASPNVSFNEVPSSIRKPGKYFELNTKNANSALPANLQKMLLIAQKSSAGAAANHVPVQIFNTSQAETLFGKGSIAHVMVRDAIRANRGLALYVAPMPDAGSTTKASRTLTVTASSVENGFFVLWVNAKRFEIVVSESETATEIAAKIETALNTDDFLPYTVAAAAGVVTLTAVNGGTLGSKVPIKIDTDSAPGVSIALAEAVAGAGDPTIQTTLDEVSSERFQIPVSSLSDATSLTALKTWITTQSNAIEKKAGRVHFGHDPATTISGAITAAAGVNDGRVSGWYFRDSLSAPYSIAAAAAAMDAFEEDPARPLNGLDLIGVGVPLDSTQLFTNTEIEALLYGGVSPILPDSSKTVAEIVRWITTYTVNGAGSPDPTLLEGPTFKTLDYVRDAIVQRLEARFPRSKKSARILGQIRTEVLDVLYRLEELEIIENVDLYKDDVIVEPDSQDINRANVKIPVDIVNGLHVIGGVIDLIL